AQTGAKGRTDGGCEERQVAPFGSKRVVGILDPEGNGEVDIGTEMQVRTVAQRDVETVQIGACHIRISRLEMQSRSQLTGHENLVGDVAHTEGLNAVNPNAMVAPTGDVGQQV